MSELETILAANAAMEPIYKILSGPVELKASTLTPGLTLLCAAIFSPDPQPAYHTKLETSPRNNL